MLTIKDIRPNPRPGFETELIREVQDVVAGLPANTASLVISRIPGHPEYTEPYFEIIPANPRAARMSGHAVIADLYLTIGKASWREFVGFSRGDRIVQGCNWREDFRYICLAVIRGGFTEHIYRDSKGKAIGWETKLSVRGEDLVIRNGRKSQRWLGRERVDSISYEPYSRDLGNKSIELG
jgi:hypothetical protein